MGDRLTPLFLEFFLEKNSDRTKNLRLRGRELFQRIGKRLCNEDMVAIARFLRVNIDVYKVDLCYNNIGNKGIKILVRECFVHYNNIEHLNLMGNNIQAKGIATLKEAADMLNLKVLRLSGNKLGTSGFEYLSEFVDTQKMTLEYLDVGDCDITVSSFPYISTMLRSDMDGNGSRLKVLDISRFILTNNKYIYDPSLVMDQLGEMLKMNQSLVEIHAQKCEISGYDIELLLFGLKRNKTLLLLDLGFNRLNNQGAELISDWLATKPNLIGLNISGNSIGDIGAKALACSLPYSKIKLLDLSYNKISDLAMSELLLRNKKVYKLKLLFIWGNTLGPLTLKVIKRQMAAGVYNQDNVDFKLFEVDNKLRVARYLTDHYKQRYYCVLDYGIPLELRIIRNFISLQDADKTKFLYYDQIAISKPECITEC